MRGSAVTTTFLLYRPADSRDRPFDLFAQRRQRPPRQQITPVELGADGSHAAADVDADGGRDDRAQGRDD